MRAGLMRWPVTIQQRITAALDSYGDMTAGWTTFATTNAQVEPTSGREYVAEGAQKGALMTRFIIRYIPGVTEQMRVLFDGKGHNIRAVLNDRQRNRQLTLVCEEGTTDG